MKLNDIPQSVLDEIKFICKRKSLQECCGVVAEKEGILQVVECSNLSENIRVGFVIDPYYFIEHDIKYVYHSHCLGSSSPSVYDMRCSDELCIPFLIYSLRDDNFYLYENVSV